MKPVGHMVTSGVLGLAVYAVKGDAAPAVSCFLAGWLIDLDHVFDWVSSLGLRRGILTLANVYGHFSYESFEESHGDVSHIYVFLHSWELIIAFWCFYMFHPVNPIITCTFAGLTLHLALDQGFNRIRSPLAYFFIYRMFHRFEYAAFLES